jgi:lycopene beta-cyclase
LKKNGFFDYIFIGAGASATLLLRSLESRGLLANKKIALIDADDKRKNDKTYCFWTSMDDNIAQNCQQLFSQTWSKISVNRQEPETLENSRYVHISSIALYDECRRIVEQHQLVRVHSSVSSIARTENGVQVITENGEFHAETIFDSRPPAFSLPEKNEALLWQTFIGYIISPSESHKQSDCVDLMDFDIPQDGYTQFMYVLPLTNNRILVEVTRFGIEPITSEQAEPILDAYIQRRFGTYTILETEKGTIPMSTAKIVREKIEGVISIGGRSGAIKPSTGYAFKKMFQGAEHLAEQLMTKKELTPLKMEPKRFQFYDRLLLLILLHRPLLGKHIFTVLFKKNNVFSVFRFLEGKTSIFEDIRILLTLPFRPFLRVLKTELSVSSKGVIAPFCMLLLSVFLLLVQTFAESYSFAIQLTLFSVGFLAVGLPHGAVDHLLESGVHVKGVKLSFIFKYLGVSFIFLLLWFLSADSALLFFLAYSIWHFGQCDFKEWIPNKQNTWKNILWGTLLFGILLIGHQTETNKILASLQTFELPFTDEQAIHISQILILISFIWSILERKVSFFLTVCMLFVGMYLPLLSAFSLYFIGQHSLNGWRHLKNGLQTNSKTLYVKSLPFNLGAIGILVISYWLNENYFDLKNNFEMATIFFVFLSCISFPHIIWMHKFYKKSDC